LEQTGDRRDQKLKLVCGENKIIKGPIWAHYFFLLVAASIRVMMGNNIIASSSHIL